MANILSRSHNFKKRVRKVIISEVKWCEVRWSKVKIVGGMCPLSGIYNYVVCMCFSLQYVFLLFNCLRAVCFKSLTLWRVLINFFLYYLFYILCVLCCVLFCVLFPYVYSCLFAIWYKFTDHCYQMETELQLINIVSLHIMYCAESCLICRNV
jgi:hypothetical protein